MVATGLDAPWGLAFAPDGRLFVTERPGRVRIIENGVLLPEPALTLTDVNAQTEAGALGLAVHPQFEQNRYVYLVYTAERPGQSPVTRLVRYRELANTLGEGVVLFDRPLGARTHDGARVRFGPDGKLYVTMGDVRDASLPQALAAFNGKIFRLNSERRRHHPVGQSLWIAGVVLRTSQSSRHRLASGVRRPVGYRARRYRERRTERDRRRQQLRLAGGFLTQMYARFWNDLADHASA